MTTLETMYLGYEAVRVAFVVGVALALLGATRIFGPRIADWVRMRRRVGRQVPSAPEVAPFEPGLVKVGDPQ